MSEDSSGAAEKPENPQATQTISRVQGQPCVATRSLPTAIGGYRILRLLGEGGMGTVYEAEQEQPRRVVALKVIRAGLMTTEMLRRFAQEAQALAKLQHPGIAQIYHAGTAENGSGPEPYFAMELIRGQPLIDYAETNHLTSRQRLELVAKIADAVHHAHQRGLIHRDLKPSNILVDKSGQPKILDFGVARINESDLQTTSHTAQGHLVGTLAYMSPEQVQGDPLELDTRSDVYTLGLILYELLAGRAPYGMSARLADAVQTIREVDPPVLSLVNRDYRGDIEIIASTALEKDRVRRYASAAALAVDIRCYLAHEPIAARPRSIGYQLRKFAQRHKTVVMGLFAVLVTLVLGLVVSTLEAKRARRAEKAALLERYRATAAEKRAESLLRAVKETGDKVSALGINVLEANAFGIRFPAPRRTSDNAPGLIRPSIMPVNGRVIVPYGPIQDPLSDENAVYGYHGGVDITASTGAPVLATADGVVIYSSVLKNFDRLVVIDHNNGYQTFYAYLSKFRIGAGHKVHRGDSIGEATKPRLHYEVHLRGVPVNPMHFMQGIEPSVAAVAKH